LDGGVITLVLPDGTPEDLVVQGLPYFVATGLVHHNQANRKAQVKLSMAIHAEPKLGTDDRGHGKRATDFALHLLNSGPLTRALSRATGLVLIVSSSLFDDVTQHEEAAKLREYKQAKVHTKGERISARIRRF
jgi:Na+(H+)/acetate symporter ActP